MTDNGCTTNSAGYSFRQLIRFILILTQKQQRRSHRCGETFYLGPNGKQGRRIRIPAILSAYALTVGARCSLCASGALRSSRAAGNSRVHY